MSSDHNNEMDAVFERNNIEIRNENKVEEQLYVNVALPLWEV